MNSNLSDFLLWSVQIDGLQEIFVFGSIHTGSPGIYKHLPKVRSIIDEVDAVLNEVDMNQLANMDASIFLNSTYPPLDKLITSKQFKKYSLVFKKITGQELSNFKYYSPFFIQYIFLKFLIADPSIQDTDSMLFEYAKINKKITGGLEDFQEHFDAVLNIPNKIHLRQLKSTIGNFSKSRKQFKQLERLYSDAQVSKIQKYSMKNMGAYKKPLLYNRNEIMAKALIEQAKNHSTLGIMGLAHLGGQKGVLNILRKKGGSIKGIKTVY